MKEEKQEVKKKKKIEISLGAAIGILIAFLFVMITAAISFYYGYVNQEDDEAYVNTQEESDKNKDSLQDTTTVDEYNYEDNYIGEVEELIQKNTYISILKNYKQKSDEILNKYCTIATNIGDCFSGVLIESNYSQYMLPKEKIEPYKDNIKLKIAELDVLLENECFMNGINYEEKESIDDKIKMQSNVYAKIPEHERNIDDLYFQITGMLVMNGNNESEKVYNEKSRAKKIKVVINNDKEYIFELKDTMEAQLIDIDYKQMDITKPIDIEIEILEKYIGTETEDVYISDIQFGLDSNVGHGI